MAIVKMTKFNLYTFKEDLPAVLRRLQSFKDVHLDEATTDAQDYIQGAAMPPEVQKLDERIQSVHWVINRLESYQDKPGTLEDLKTRREVLSLSELNAKAKTVDFDPVYAALKRLDTAAASYENRIEKLRAENNEWLPYKTLSVAPEELKALKRTAVYLGAVSARGIDGFKASLRQLDYPYETEFISEHGGYEYMLAMTDKDRAETFADTLRSNGFQFQSLELSETVKAKLESNEAQIAQLNDAKRGLDREYQQLAPHLDGLKYYYEALRNERLRLASAEKGLETKRMSVLQGYVETANVAALDKALANLGPHYIEWEEAKAEDNVPIKLKNTKIIRPFESITEMYAIPKYGEIDPTPFLAPFYFVFSGIMIGDMGYGILTVLLCLILLKGFKPDIKKAKLITFVLYMGISSIFWGFIFGSFFGDLIPMKAYISPSEDYMTMIAMCMLFGVIHIFFAMSIKAYMAFRDGKPLDALFDVGLWYMALIGAILTAGSGALGLEPIVGQVAKVVMIIGMVGILLTGGRTEKSVAGKIGWGIYSLYGISSYLGDFVSYFRLMALALSGSFIAIAVNIIVRMLFSSGILGIIAGILIFVAFQLFNIFLSFLSSYVHTARLTFVEMFNKFYEGGGTAFKEMMEQSDYFIYKEDTYERV
ncbi:V-type ATP synthase subunit I [Peptoniphilus equinus]|uniref:V-type ATP synthase subunit I n=1 Tax=Peptoniphilus equinus TaxID=3016343 RepID=A0ABY7QSS6_9FIRM|nr:V-type ATP synthase subunit I [Peptoniphilus equinus]WBW49848.1 V-type ATP synthase subunit I [Peptoniphilus equinus]